MADHTRVGLKSLSLVFVLLREFNRGFFILCRLSKSIIYFIMLYYNNSRTWVNSLLSYKIKMLSLKPKFGYLKCPQSPKFV